MDPRSSQVCSPTAQAPGPDVTVMTRRKFGVKTREQRKRQRQEEGVRHLGWGWGVGNEEEVVRDSNREAGRTESRNPGLL